MEIRIYALYIGFLSLLTFLLFGLDKRNARRGQRRIPESTLFLYALLGGSAGALAAMYFFRHKTRHFSFTAGIPAIFLLHTLLSFYLYTRFFR